MRPLFSKIILFYSFFALAQNTESFDFGNYPLDNSLLWKIEGNGLSAPSYLFGTMHMVCKDSFNLNPNVSTAMNQTDQLYLEIDMSDTQNITKIQSLVIADTKLSDSLSSVDYSILDSLMTQKLGMGLANFDQFHPAFIYIMIMEPSLNCQPISVESELISLNQGKQVYGIETTEYQLNMMKNIFNYDNLLEAIQEIDPNETKDLTEAYYNSDLNSIYQISEKSISKDPKLGEQLLFERNKNWVNEMSSIMKANPTFFGVGAAHLVSKSGLIKLLRDAGYKVTAVH